MKNNQFFWAWNDQELKPYTANRAHESAILRVLRKQKRLIRIAPYTYKAWTNGNNLTAIIKTR